MQLLYHNIQLHLEKQKMFSKFEKFKSLREMKTKIIQITKKALNIKQQKTKSKQK